MPKRNAFSVLWPFLILLLVGAGLLVNAVWRPSPPPEQTVRWTVQLGTFEEWIPLSGRLEAANPITFRAERDGLSKLTFLAEDGTPVSEGDVIARFDQADLAERKRNLSRDHDIASARVTSLRDAEHPLALQRVEQELVTVESDLSQEALYLSETEALVEEGLLAQEELNLYQQNITTLTSRKNALQTQLRLTRDVMHPSEHQIAEARLTAAKEGLRSVQDDLDSTVIRAPADGTVHLPVIPIDGERRPVRVGDGLFRNQIYMEVANLTDLVIRTDVGERLLARVLPGMQAIVRLPALPDRSYQATVASVGAYPRGARRRYPVEVQWDSAPDDLRPGLTATLEVLSTRQENKMVVPRSFLDWQGSDLYVHTPNGKIKVEPGRGNGRGMVITSGIRPGLELIKP